MTNPTPLRKQDVLSKIDYAKHRHQELMNELFAAKNASRDPAFLVHTAADIISTVRECFDYLGQDIIECYILPNTSNQRIIQDYAAGKLRSYFPYYSSQITSNSVFHELVAINSAVYQSLQDFISSVASNATIPNTLFTYQIFVDVKDMVNQKKHDKLIGVISNNDKEYLIQNENIKIVVPMSGQVGWSSFSVEPGLSVSRVSEYRFDYNNQEVSKFCLFATEATQHVIMSLYDKHFA
ncbi:MAG TPA: hypothetical protein V6D25_27245 [Leptolyngbyaceae cyanobacterium]